MRDCDDAKREGDSVEFHLACTRPVYFQIDETTFAISQISLLDSEFFTSLLTSKHLGEPEEGTVFNPIKLSDITKADMESFIMVLDFRGREHPVNLNPGEWTSALRLSTMWSFQLLREYIVRRIEDLPNPDPVWRIELAKAYDIPKWLSPMYHRLCMRDEPLSVGEGARLGLPTFAALCRIRERIRNHKLRIYRENVIRTRGCSHSNPYTRSNGLCKECFWIPGDDIWESAVLQAITNVPELATLAVS